MIKFEVVFSEVEYSATVTLKVSGDDLGYIRNSLVWPTDISLMEEVAGSSWGFESVEDCSFGRSVTLHSQGYETLSNKVARFIETETKKIVKLFLFLSKIQRPINYEVLVSL